MKRYGTQDQHREDPTACVAQIWTHYSTRQCSRKRGHGPDGDLCKQHAKRLMAGQHVSIPPDEPILKDKGTTKRTSAQARKEHRAAYPAQYSHPLCGKSVRVKDRSFIRYDINVLNDATDVVVRVVTTRHGELAILRNDPRTAYLVASLEVVS